MELWSLGRAMMKGMMWKGAEFRLFSACLVLCLLPAGCSSGSKSSTGGGGGGAGALQFTSPTAGPVIELSQSVGLTVNQPVTWALHNGNGNGNACGTLSNATTTFVTYNAVPYGQQGSCLVTPPTSCPAFGPSPYPPQQATVVATAIANLTESASINVTVITSQPCITTAATYAACPAAGTVVSPLSNQVFQVGAFAQVNIGDGGSQNQNPFGVPPFTWKVTSGSLPPGLVLGPGPDSSSVVISGIPATTGCSGVTLQITDSTGASSSQAYGLVVVPPALKVQIPSYADSYINSSTNAGVPYVPTSLSVSGGLPPYLWAYQTPGGFSNFPGGLCLSSSISDVPSGCVSSSPPASSSLGVIWGTPLASDIVDEQNNGGPFAVQLQINDSQLPYPAVALPNLSMTVFPLQSACPAAPDLQPSTINGGVSGDGSVPANAYLQGSFAFLVRGFDTNGPVVIAGSVTADGNGGITGGVEDITRSNGSQSVTVLSAGSSYSVGGTIRVSALGGPGSVYNRGCMTLANSAGTTTTFAFSLGGCSNNYKENGTITTNDSACGMKQNAQSQNVSAGTYTTGRIIEFDDSVGTGTRGSGILRLQDSSSFSNGGFSGLYAFGFAGSDSAGGRYAIAGSTQAGSGSLSSAAADLDDAGTLGSHLTGGSGSYSIASNGRGTGTLTVGPATFDLAFYMVSAGEAIAVTTDPLSASHPVVGGELIKTSGSFSTSTLQNSHIFHIGGLASSGPDVSVGVLTFDGIGGVGGTIYEDQAGTLGTTTVSAAYSVDGTAGRAVFQTPQPGQTLGSHPFIAYLIPPASTLTRANCSQPASCITGFLVGTDGSAQDGVLEFQTSLVTPPPPFGNPYVAGDYVYGSDESLDASTTQIDGTLSSNTISLGNRTQDASYANPGYCLQAGCLLLVPDETLSTASFTVNANGTGVFGGQTVSVTNGNVVFFIDESPMNLHPTVEVAEQ